MKIHNQAYLCSTFELHIKKDIIDSVLSTMADRVGTLEQRHAHAWLALAIGSLLEDLKENPRDTCLRRIGGVLVSDPAQEFGRQGTVCTSKALMAKDFIKKMGYVEEIVFKAVFSPASRNAYEKSGGSMNLEELTGLLKAKLAEYTTVDRKLKRIIADLEEKKEKLSKEIEELKTENARLGKIVNLEEEIRKLSKEHDELRAGSKELGDGTLRLSVELWETLLSRAPPNLYYVGHRDDEDKLCTQYLTKDEYVAWQISQLFPEEDVAVMSKRQRRHRLEDMDGAKRNLEESLSEFDSISQGLGKAMHYFSLSHA